MPDDYPDWGTPPGRKAIHPVTDLGELAARLGSIDTFHRGGDVILLDGFEDGLSQWNTLAGGTGASVAVSTTSARNGGYSGKAVTGDVAGNTTQIFRGTGYPALSKFGVELSFASSQTDWRIYIETTILNGVNSNQFTASYNQTDNTVSLQKTDGTYEALSPAIAIAASNYHYNTLKLVVDGPTLKYDKILFNDTTFNVSAYAPYAPVSTAAKRITVTITVSPTVAANKTVYLDDFILTQNEP